MQCNYHLLSINFALHFVDTDIFTIGYEPADLTVKHPPPPPQNCQGWVHFFRISV